MNPPPPAGYYNNNAAYGTTAPAPSASAAQHQQQYATQQPVAPAAAYGTYAQVPYAAPPATASAVHHQQYGAQPQHHYAAAPGAYAPAPAAYGAYPQQQQPGVYPQQQQLQQQQQQQQYQHQHQHQQQPPQQKQQQQVSLPLLATPPPPPAAPGQTLAAYAYPGGAPTTSAPPPAVGAGVGAGQAITPQQVAQEAIAKTMAAMQEKQLEQLQPGQVLDNRRGYLHGNLIGKMEKARLERAALKNENYVRRKDEIARRKRLGLPLDGLIDKSTLSSGNAGGGGGAAGGKTGVRHQQATGGGGQSRAGIGTAAARPQNTSVYIAGLPTDITQAKIELVFSQYGSVKRTKVYRDDAGQVKGDGLVIYAKPASVDLAVAKLNGHEITAGHPISVSMADFNRNKGGAQEEASEPPPPPPEQQAPPPPPPPPHSSNGEEDGGGAGGAEGMGEGAADYGGALPPLPAECGADKHPVVVLRSVYTREESDADPNFFDDLEADMLMECVKFGTVISVATPETPGYFGSVVVTFDNSGGANKCAEAMHGRWFDQRQIEALVTGKVVLGEPEEGPDQNRSADKGQSQDQDQGQEEAGQMQGCDRKESEGEGKAGDGGEEDMGPLLQGAPDSPPPTDLNSFLESV